MTLAHIAPWISAIIAIAAMLIAAGSLKNKIINADKKAEKAIEELAQLKATIPTVEEKLRSWLFLNGRPIFMPRADCEQDRESCVRSIGQQIAALSRSVEDFHKDQGEKWNELFKFWGSVEQALKNGTYRKPNGGA